MNPNEPNNPGGAGAMTDKPSMTSETASSLKGLEDAIAKAKFDAGIATAAPIAEASQETSAVDSKKAYLNQFDPIGSVQQPVNEGPAPASVLTDTNLTDVKPPVAEAISPVVPLDSGANSINDLLKGPQVGDNLNSTAETAVPAEKTPADILKEKIAADIDTFLEEVTAKKKVAV